MRSPTFYATDGRVWRRSEDDDYWLETPIAQKLLGRFREIASSRDWFAPDAKVFAEQLERAIEEVKQEQAA